MVEQEGELAQICFLNQILCLYLGEGHAVGFAVFGRLPRVGISSNAEHTTRSCIETESRFLRCPHSHAPRDATLASAQIMQVSLLRAAPPGSSNSKSPLHSHQGSLA